MKRPIYLSLKVLSYTLLFALALRLFSTNSVETTLAQRVDNSPNSLDLSRELSFSETLVRILLAPTRTLHAAPPSSTYLPGETLDPSCSPGDTNCSVDSGPAGSNSNIQFNDYSRFGAESAFTYATTTGNVGIGTSSPYAKLSVTGEIVSNYFTATSTTATSTLSGALKLATSGKGLEFPDGTIQTTAAVSSASVWTDNGAYISPTNDEFLDFSYFIATSTSATSTVQLSLNVGTSTSYGTLSVDGTLGISSTNGAVVIGDTSGDARGDRAFDVQSFRNVADDVASGKDSIAFGVRNTASGTNSIAVGYANTASGDYSNAVGYNHLVNGFRASAFGRSNIASGFVSTASGYSNTVNASGSSVFGSEVYNFIATSTQIGPSDAAKLTILSTGDLGLASTSPTYMLHVPGEGYFSSYVDASHFIATSTSATSTFAGGLTVDSSDLVVDPDAGRVGIGTTTPGSTLSVAGDSYTSGTSTTGALTLTGSGTGILFQDGTYQKTAASGGAWTTSGSNIYYDSGNVSVGTTTSDSLLYVQGGDLKVDPTTNGWDITNASYDVKTFDVNSQEGSPQGLFFRDNGTTMYVIGDNDTVYQYTLSTAWDVSTASYASKSFSANSQDSAATDLFFKSDGATMYVIGNTNDSVFQYTLSTPWDVSTASYASKSFSVNTQEANPQGVFFKSDGTAMYAVGLSNDTVYQYTLSTAWDVSTASYASKSFSISSQDGNPYGLAFSDDGTKMFVSGSGNDDAHQYTLSTPWDVSTASYDSQSVPVIATETNLTGVTFGDTGEKMYLIGTVSNSVFQYTSIGYEDGDTILTNGKFGIGSTTPTSKLTLSGGNFTHVANNLTTVSETNLGSGYTSSDIYVSGKYLYIGRIKSTDTNLYVYDISNPTAPVQESTPSVGATSASSGPLGMYAAGNYLYFSVSEEGLYTFDISNKNSISTVDTITASFSDEFLRHYVSGNYLYATRNDDNLYVYDITDPTTPVLLSNVWMGGGQAYEVYVQGDYAYVASGSLGLKVIDISDPSSISVTGTYNSPGSAEGVRVIDKYAYVADGGSGLNVVDVSNPASPSSVGSYDTNDDAVQVEIRGDYAYVADSGGGLVVLDVSDPTSPILAGSWADGGASDIFIQGKYGYVSHGANWYIIDLNSITTPSLYAGSVSTDGLSSTGNVIIGNDLYVGNGLTIGISGLFTQGGSTALATTTAKALKLTGSGTGILFQDGTYQTTASPWTDNGGYLSPTADEFLDIQYLIATSTSATSTFAGGLTVDSSDLVVDPDAGRVGIGTTTPDSTLTVDGTILATNLYGGATTLSVDANGNIIRTPSDQKLKENITPITNALEKVLNLEGVSYTWQDPDRFGPQTEIGLIAQEVEQVVPEVVRSGGEYKSLNYQNLVALLINAIKELDQKINRIAVSAGVVVDGIGDLVVGTLKVGSPERPIGIVLYDELTGEPYCLSISGGETKTQPGECAVDEESEDDPDGRSGSLSPVVEDQTEEENLTEDPESGIEIEEESEDGAEEVSLENEITKEDSFEEELDESSIDSDQDPVEESVEDNPEEPENPEAETEVEELEEDSPEEVEIPETGTESQTE